jgi:hypothetical protein
MKKIFILFFIFSVLATSAISVSADTTYYRVLADQRVSTMKDACRVITIFLGKEAELKDFQSQLSHLQSENIIPKKANTHPDAAIHKDELAYMVFQALKLNGGVMLNALRPFLGVTPRYAYKECVYYKLIEDENPKALVEGKELIGVLSRMSAFQASRG